MRCSSLPLRPVIGWLLTLVGWLPGGRLLAAPPPDTTTLRRELAHPGLPPARRAELIGQLAVQVIDADPAYARRLLTEGVALLRRTGPVPQEIKATLMLSGASAMLGDYPAAARTATTALERVRQTGTNQLLGSAYYRLAANAFAQQETAHAAGLYEQAVAAMDRYSPADEILPGALASLANCYLELDQPDRARPVFRRNLQVAQARHEPRAEFAALAAWGNGLRLRQPDSAALYLERALALAQRMQNPQAEAYARLVLLQTRHAQGRWPEVQRLAALVIRDARALAMVEYEEQALELLADALRYTGRPAAALDTMYAALRLRDTLASAEKRTELARQQARMGAVEQQARIRELAARNALQNLALAAGAGGLLLLALLAGLLFNRYRLKRRAVLVLEGKNAEIARRDREKETLLREMHHRVKNNLQVVSSLLSLQSRQLTDEGARAAIQDSKSRVEAMALLHQKLYQHEELRHIALPDYVRLLTRTVLGTYGFADDVATLDVADVAADVEIALPLGLLLNELLTNACKYALPGRPDPRVTVTLHRLAGEGLLLRVADNGPGLSPTAAPPTAERSFGQRLIRLLTQQLEAELTWSTAGGTVAELRVPSMRFAAEAPVA